MTIGFSDANSNLFVPDREVKRSVKPVYSLNTLGDGYESRISIGTNATIEVYDVTFNNRSIEEINNIALFLEEREKHKNFYFTVPTDSGEKTVVVYCEGYSRTYVTDVIGSISAKFIQVFEEQIDLPYVAITSGNISTGEGTVNTVDVSTNNRGPELLYWSIDGATTADFTAVNGSFSTSGTLLSCTGSFDVEVLADVKTEGTEIYTISVRQGSVGGFILASIRISIEDTSLGAETFNFVDSGGANISSGILEATKQTTLYVGVTNFNPNEKLYFSIDPIVSSVGLITPVYGELTLTGTFAESDTSQIITSISEVTKEELRTVNLRKNSISGEIVDSFLLSVIPETFIGARITNSQGQDIDFVVLEVGSPFTTTLYYTANFFDVQTIYWTIENAIGGGADFDFVSGSFLPTGTTENNTATFDIIKQSGTFPEVYTIYLRTGSASGPIIDVCTLIYADVYLTASEEVSSSHALYNLNFSTTEVTKRFNRIPGIITTDSASSSIGLFNVSFNPKLDSTNIERKGQILFTAIDSATSEVALDNLNFSTAEVTKRFDKIEGIVTTDTSSGRGGINNLSFSGIATLNRI